jgi:basic amino acid/polyamine antiporter, APA family
MAFSAASYAELSTRYPVSAGEAAYVRAGTRSRVLSAIVGLLVILSGIVSSAAISIGSTGYIREFVDVPPLLLVSLLVCGLGAIAAWGIMESIIVASLFTLFETGALLFIIVIGIADNPTIIADIPRIFPDVIDSTAWAAIGSAGLLAFFAFIGFEDMVNLAEEIKDPERVLPRAILLTLVIGTLIYFLLTTVVVLSVPLGDLAQSEAPLSFVFLHITGASPFVITLIAIFATLNGVIIQIIMASRVLFGMAKQGVAPSVFAGVNSRTQTPVMATVAVSAIILFLALTTPLEDLAEWTSRVVLAVFAFINISLILIKLRREPSPDSCFKVWIGIPVFGFVMSVALIFGPLFGT